MAEIVLDALLDALVDSAKMLPVLFLIYVLIEVLEVKLGDRLGAAMARAGKAGPLVGALAGIVPQCGLSVVGAAMYTQRLVTVGTLFAVLLATSDEAIPIMLSEPGAAGLVGPLILTKLVIAIAVGYALDLVFHKRNARLMEQAGTPAAGNHAAENPAAGAPAPCACGCAGHASSAPGAEGAGAEGQGGRRLTARDLLVTPLRHTMEVFVFILLTSFVLALVFALVGHDALSQALAGHPVLQPALAALVGLIPNCAASVAVTEFYLEGVITYGAAIAGLCAGGGLGVLVLIKEDRHAEAAAILAGLYAVSVLAGLAVQALGIGA